MNSAQTDTLGKRLSEIGFSDRAVNMILEQVEIVSASDTQSDGLSEQAVPFQAFETDASYKTSANTQSDVGYFVVAGACVVFISIFLGWSALTSNDQANLAIMTSNSTGASWYQGVQAMILAGWVALPPLFSVWQGNIDAKLRQIPTLAVWGSFGLALGTLLLASTS